MAQDLALEIMAIWVLRVITKARVKQLSMEMADMDHQRLDKIAAVMVGDRHKDMTDKAVVLLKMFTMHLRLTTTKVEDMVRLLPRIRTPRIMASMEVQLVDLEDSLKGNIRTINIQTTGDHFLLQIVSTPPTLHDL